ncbi:hypothetical protein [Mariniblastus fucicola]|uniref:Uncharacterized protein n=1 Tax=Mariniblastus fucicola TaxID=980251 RepID=A0A5B9PJ66_9BACT|nr:hypothetical protein [Mariniblastus fucicola]QEG24722.1 hypothetical protein MFFC18_46440 [Mariniblastus fucicola]
MSKPNQNPQRPNLFVNSEGIDTANENAKQSIKGYTRAVRRKLYFLFAMLILVMVLMKEARKPENWMWMGFKRNAANAEAIELNGFADSSSADLDLSQLASDGPVGLLSQADSSDASAKRLPTEQSRDAFWKRTWDSLEVEDKTALVELIQLSQKRLDERDVNLADFDPLLSSINQASPEDAAYRDPFESTIRPGLVAVASGEDVTLNQQAALKKLFHALDPLILKQLDDFTSPGRKSDMPAWQRFWGRILEDDFDENPQAVSPVQLVAQPDAWRFKPVRVHGKLLAGRAKVAGIHGPLRHQEVWYEWWVGNSHGADEVWCIYTADKPEILEVGEKFTDFDVAIECSGLFYKVRSYVDSQSKGNHCPLILAKTLHVNKKNNPVAEATWTPSVATMIGCVIAVLGIAFAIAMLVHRADSLKVHQPGGEYKKVIEDNLDALSDDPDIKSIAERLEELP